MSIIKQKYLVEIIQFSLVGFYSISAVVSYLFPNPVHTYIINMICKQFLSITFLNKPKHFFTQLNDQTVLFPIIQFSISHLFAHSINVRQFYLTHR